MDTTFLPFRPTADAGASYESWQIHCLHRFDLLISCPDPSINGMTANVDNGDQHMERADRAG